MRTVQIRSHRVVIGRCFRNEVTVLIDGVDVTKNLTGEGKPETYDEPEES